PIIIGYLSARVVYEHLATKTMRFNGYLGNSPLHDDICKEALYPFLDARTRINDNIVSGVHAPILSRSWPSR
ncbi:hypothetical protein D3OALGB2SA_3771, partial [Olavius algarvensis associated proteobacterium Delta 3]